LKTTTMNRYWRQINRARTPRDTGAIMENPPHASSLSASAGDDVEAAEMLHGLSEPTRTPVEDDDDVGDESQDNITVRKKRAKRIVGTQSGSIKQMKDAVVRTQAIIVASKVATIQGMTTYDTATKNANNPLSHTILINFDEIVPRPDKVGEGERYRTHPMFTVLMPKHLDPVSLGFEFENLGKAMQKWVEQPKNAPPPKKVRPKKGSKKTTTTKEGPINVVQPREFDFDMEITFSDDDYLASIYGPDVKRMKK
jgi:hypothetical protein